jgi:FixJ family two-component response regulator
MAGLQKLEPRQPLVAEASTNPDAVVFVVDDDPDVRGGLKSLFESVGIACRVFKSADEFIAHQRIDTVSCLVLDVRLPGPSGLDFQADLGADGIDIPIIFITGHGDVPMSVKAMKAGAVEFLIKPLRDQDLLDATRLAFEHDRKRRESRGKLQDMRERFDALSDRQREVLSLVSAGLMNKQIAFKMKLSEVTVKVHRRRLMKRLGVKSVPELVRVVEALKIPAPASTMV